MVSLIFLYSFSIFHLLQQWCFNYKFLSKYFFHHSPFWYAAFLCLSISKIFHPLNKGAILHIFVNFLNFLVTDFIPLWVADILSMSVLLNESGFILWPSRRSILDNVSCATEKTYSSLLGTVFHRTLIRSIAVEYVHGFHFLIHLLPTFLFTIQRWLLKALLLWSFSFQLSTSGICC